MSALTKQQKRTGILSLVSDCPVLREEKVIINEAPDEKVMINNQPQADSEQCVCGKKVISPGSPLCASCMAVRKAHRGKEG